MKWIKADDENCVDVVFNLMMIFIWFVYPAYCLARLIF